LKLEHIRNFCIVAHIDHGKSTLADRLIEATGMLQKREMKAQVLDTLDLERERGITIKLNAVRMTYTARDGQEYELNLIDTPGHVDFTYEVSRSLAACEGAILVVDASQGIEAQTLSNLFLAVDAGLEIIPILNKIDLPGAEPEKRRKEVADLLGIEEEAILLVSAKEGIGIGDLLEEVVRKVPPPEGDDKAPLRALIYDSYYDKYRGAIPSVRVVDGVIRKGTHITFGASESVYEVDEVGYNQLRQVPTDQLGPGEVGYVVASVRSVSETRAGDTIFDAENHAKEALPGYKAVRSFVFAGLYPTDTTQYETLRDALEKLKLNDASLNYEPETSTALGFGFRAGFLGLLHMEIVQERWRREFDLELVTTVPSVEYKVYLTDGTMKLIENPSLMPSGQTVAYVEEPYVKARIMVPAEYIGPIMTLGTERRGVYKNMTYLDTQRVELDWEFPLGEIILDFFDKLKTVSRGDAAHSGAGSARASGRARYSGWRGGAGKQSRYSDRHPLRQARHVRLGPHHVADDSGNSGQTAIPRRIPRAGIVSQRTARDDDGRKGANRICEFDRKDPLYHAASLCARAAPRGETVVARNVALRRSPDARPDSSPALPV
jgi:GTP-binding protein LepA